MSLFHKPFYILKIKTNLEASKVSAMYKSDVFLSVNCILSEENKQQMYKTLVHFTVTITIFIFINSIYVKTLYK